MEDVIVRLHWGHISMGLNFLGRWASDRVLVVEVSLFSSAGRRQRTLMIATVGGVVVAHLIRLLLLLRC